ncbi:MAG: MFS transporter [Candidatus Doudnabacteria bacterium]|nr:MFS transporter [Candidatus Doudnabacteria bacterium]
MSFPLPHPHYFSYKINREVKEIYWHVVLNGIAFSLAYVFEPIYLYLLNYSLVQILWFYVAVYVGYAVLVSFGAKFASRFGYKHSILASSIMLVGYWACLYFIKDYPNLFFVAAIMFALQKSFYWPAFNAEMSLSAPNKQRGREVGVLFSLTEVAYIFGPFVGGLISYKFGFGALFASAAVLLLIAVYPLFRSADIYANHTFYFKNLLSIFLQRTRNFFGYFGYAEDLMLMSLWPIFIFIMVPEIFSVGAILTSASILALFIMLYLGKLVDKAKHYNLLKLTALFYGLTWVFRFLAQSIPTVLAFDVLGKVGKGTVNVPMVSLTYGLAAGKGPEHAIAYAVFYEFSLSIGKIFTALLGIAILSMGGSIFYVFILTGLLTMLYGLLRK